METKNLGLVKAIFRQSNPPTRTDVLWYDSVNNILKGYDFTGSKWMPYNHYLSGAVTDGAPTGAEIDAIVGLTAVNAGAGFQVTIKDSTGSGLLYQVESDGVDWFYVALTKAL